MAGSLADNSVAGKASTLTVLDPTGYPVFERKKRAASRTNGLDGKTIYIVDVRFDDSTALLKRIEAWFAANQPNVTVRLVSPNGVYSRNDTDLWEEIAREGHAAIVGVGHCSTCVPAVVTHAIRLESDYGVPTVALHTNRFQSVVRSVTTMHRLPEAPQAYVPQPVMGKSAAELQAYVEGLDPVTGRPFMQEIVEALTLAPLPPKDAKRPTAQTERYLRGDSEAELYELFLRRNWTDGLPIVLPTPERVDAMLAHTSHRPDEIVGRLQPTSNRGFYEFTVEKVAVNAVMAGAHPTYFPVILALAASGITARSSSTSSAGTMVVVNGPIRHEIEMNSGIGAMGPYSHANATIGRAYGLLSQNLQGGSVPGETYMGSQGNGYSFTNLTFAENEEDSPWEPLHVQLGFGADESVASIFGGCRSSGFSLGLRETYWRDHVRDLLVAVDPVAAPALLLDPLVARQFVDRGGFVDKAALIDFVFETATMPAARFWDLQLVQNYIYPETHAGTGRHPAKLDAAPDEPVPMFARGDINVVVVGGSTNGYWHVKGAKRAKSVRIDDWR